jgi:hypothetical protein
MNCYVQPLAKADLILVTHGPQDHLQDGHSESAVQALQDDPGTRAVAGKFERPVTVVHPNADLQVPGGC